MVRGVVKPKSVSVRHFCNSGNIASRNLEHAIISLVQLNLLNPNDPFFKVVSQRDISQFAVGQLRRIIIFLYLDVGDGEIQ